MKLFLWFLFTTIALASGFTAFTHNQLPRPPAQAPDVQLASIDPSTNRKIIPSQPTPFVEPPKEAYVAPVQPKQEKIVYPIVITPKAPKVVIVAEIIPPVIFQLSSTQSNVKTTPPEVTCPNNQLLVSLDTILGKAECQMSNGRIYTISIK